MPVTFGGMASGVDTEGIIKKLVEVESRPIIQWEEDKKRFNIRKDALGKLRIHVNDLNNAVKDLYGFRAVYKNKKALSSDPHIVEATANKYAKKGTNRIQVQRLASTHKISTDPVSSEEQLPAGKFNLEVNGESHSIKFKGGSLKSLQEKIEETASDILTSFYINTSGKNHTMTLESKVPGKKGEIKITGDKELLKKIGLVKGELGESKEKVDVVFDEKFFTSYMGGKKIEDQNGNLQVEKTGKSVRIKGTLWREYVLPLQLAVKDDTILEVNIQYNPPKKEEEEDVVPGRIEIGPDSRINIKGIELKGYNISRIKPPEERKKKKDLSDLLGVGIVSMEKEKRVEKIYEIDKNAKGKQELPIGRDFKGKTISKIIFYCNDGEAKFSDARLLTPTKGLGLLEPKNLISKNEDAKFKLDGIDLIRDRNDNLTDVIKGVTVNLKSKSDRLVTITVEGDSKKALEKIKRFVETYNRYLEYNKEITKADRTGKPGEYRKSRYKNGIFMSDMTLLRLENNLKTSVSNAYPNKAENPIKLITQMGISTGNLNAEWGSIKDGKLIIDETKLSDVLSENPEGVSDFFGSDNDGDNKVDNGMAFRVENILKPFIMSGKNIIQTKIDLEDSSIQIANEKIERQQEHLRKYEDKLRAKFAAMEKAVSGAKAQGNWMNQQMGGGPKGKGDK